MMQIKFDFFMRYSVTGVTLLCGSYLQRNVWSFVMLQKSVLYRRIGGGPPRKGPNASF